MKTQQPKYGIRGNAALSLDNWLPIKLRTLFSSARVRDPEDRRSRVPNWQTHSSSHQRLAIVLGMGLSLLLVTLSWLWSPAVFASPLVERLAQFPDWQDKPPLEAAQGDLVYPEWMEGTWTATSSLDEMVAPLAPELVTPGFEGNRQYLDRSMSFSVRFVPQVPKRSPRSAFPMTARVPEFPPIVADRAFNGTNISRAYLGDKALLSVQVDPDDPNRQITALRGDRQLVSIVSRRNSETPAPDRFVATELIDQVFRSSSQIYFNQVESTTAYHQISPTQIEAEQVTAIYLSPQDPNYFKAGNQPVALYHYNLVLSK